MTVEQEVRWSWWKRVIQSFPSSEMVSLGALASGFLAAILKEEGSASYRSLIFYFFGGMGALFLVLLVLLLIVKAYAEYDFRTQDSSLIKDSDDKFFSNLEIKKRRAIAAYKCEEHLSGKEWEENEGADYVEYVLDFFTVLGADLKAGRFSDQVAHMYFYYWILGWHTLLNDYVKFYRGKNHTSSTFENFELLFQRTLRIEERSKTAQINMSNEMLKFYQ